MDGRVLGERCSHAPQLPKESRTSAPSCLLGSHVDPAPLVENAGTIGILRTPTLGLMPTIRGRLGNVGRYAKPQTAQTSGFDSYPSRSSSWDRPCTNWTSVSGEASPSALHIPSAQRFQSSPIMEPPRTGVWLWPRISRPIAAAISPGASSAPPYSFTVRPEAERHHQSP